MLSFPHGPWADQAAQSYKGAARWRRKVVVFFVQILCQGILWRQWFFLTIQL
jgi:hypothetical protein